MIFFRPRKVEDYAPFISLEADEAVKVPGAEVVWADHRALKRDFAFLEAWPAEKIDAWIVDQFSCVSKNQIDLGELRNSKIPATNESITVFRQANYGSKHQEFQGRGDCMIVRDPVTKEQVGLIDRKGVGVSRTKVAENRELLENIKKNNRETRTIETINLSNGLMFLGEALIEAAALKCTQKVFDLLNARGEFDQPFGEVGPFKTSPLQTIEGYFVLKLPFLLHAGEHGSYPAAIYGRQAHVGRVWTGKIYTQRVNIKQADFFFALCDGGTVRLRLPELEKTAERIKGGPELVHYQVGLDMVEAIARGEKNVLEKRIAEVLAPIANELAELEKRGFPLASRSYATPEEAFADLLDTVLSDPKRYCRFSEVLWYAMKHDPELAFARREKIAQIARAYLKIPADILDIDNSNKPMRRWGLLLASALPLDERVRVLKAALASFGTEPEFLGRSAFLYPFDDVKPFLRRLYRQAGGWLKTELESVNADARKALNPRMADWKRLEAAILKRGKAPRPVPLKVQEQVVRDNWRTFMRFWN